MASPMLQFDVSPYRLSGTVYCALMNHSPMLSALGDAVHQPPYKAPPKEPILAVRPRNTLAAETDSILVPEAMPELEVGASLGIVIGQCASRVPLDRALSFVAGYLAMNDVNAPLPNHYRPAIRFKARDGFCAMGSAVTPADQVPEPDALAVRVLIDGQVVQTSSTADRLRGVAQLISDVTEFMTLQAGDVLMLGVAAGAPLVHAGQTVRVEIDSVGSVTNAFVSEQVSA